MPDFSSKAVFLSHASQDDEAAKRICAGLRSGGVEVWFDSDGGLEHGDEWDAKIRRQIKDCILFMPIISAATQARHEGYFRIEWDLAAERSRGFASGVPFILPVVIDDTREPEALVPDRFRTVQWIRLPGGRVTPEFLARFLKLWSHRTGVLTHEAAMAPPATSVPALAPPMPPRGRKARAALVAGAVVVAVATCAELGRRHAGPAVPAAAGTSTAVAPPSDKASPAAVDPRSVAVLPFENLSDDKENEYFSDGVSEELLSVLAKIPGLHVAAHTSSFYFKGRNATVQEIGAKLGVANLVEGSVRRSGNTVRIAARLSRAATGEQLWSESYTRDLKDVFAVQTELAQTIVGQLRQQLGAPEAKTEIAAQVQAAEKGGTANPEAHRLYLQGRYYLQATTIESIDRGAALLQRAVDLDPDYAQAWSDLAYAGGLINGYGLTKDDVIRGTDLARRAADRALQVAPDLAASHLARSGVQLDDFDWKGAAESLHRAKQLDPGNSDVIWSEAILALTFGRTTLGIDLGLKAAELDPINSVIRTYVGYGLGVEGRFKEAREQFQQVLELAPNGAWGHGGIALTFLWEGRYGEGLPEAEQVTAEWLRLTEVAVAQWGLGHKAESEVTLQKLISKFADVAAYQIAENYAIRDDRDQAFAWLERAYRQRDPGLERLRIDHSFDGIRSDPRWDTFVHLLGLADEQVKALVL